jgi:molybdopterin converting factor small subunit
MASPPTVTVHIPTQLRNYTNGSTRVETAGATVDEALMALDARFPGIRFRVIDEQGRIRQHMRIFVDGERAPSAHVATGSGAEIHLFGALSGG